MNLGFLAFVFNPLILSALKTSSVTLEVMKDQIKSIVERVQVIQDYSPICHHNKTMSPTVTPRRNIYSDCHEVYKAGGTSNGVYEISIFLGYTTLPIFCDQETLGLFSDKRGWMTIQRRIDGEVNFDRGWNDYLNGFGFPDKEHWIGLRNILKITKQKKLGQKDKTNQILRIDLEDWDGNKVSMEYSSFSILSEEYSFAIQDLGSYSGTNVLRNHLAFSMYAPFSTYDHNTDKRRTKTCITSQRGGWWFGSCNNLNLNGIYPGKNEKVDKKNIFVRDWNSINRNNTAIRYVSIKLQ